MTRPRPIPPRPARLLAVAALGLLASSCGGPATVRVPGSEVRLTLDEYRIRPGAVSVRPGRIKIEARDTGLLTHNFRVERLTGGGIGPAVVYATSHTAHPGQVVTVKVTLRPGTYRLACTLSNHADLGQIATLIVR